MAKYVAVFLKWSYGIVDGEDAGLRLAERVRALFSTMGAAGTVCEGPFRTDGARV